MINLKKTRFISLLLTFLMIISVLSTCCLAASDTIKVYRDGRQLSFDVDPCIINSRTMVPMRAIFEDYGMTVSWTDSSKTITATKGSQTIIMQIGNNTINNNGKSVYTDVAPLIKNSRTLVPLRVISECLGMQVTWDDNSRSVYITSSGNSSVDPYVQQVVDLVNQYRAENGLAPLEMSLKLNEVAEFKAKDMADNNYFSHTSPTYGSPSDLLDMFNVDWYMRGENIAMGQRSPQEVMTDWMNSSGHRANILGSSFGHIGVGLAKNQNGYIYWVQEFTN